MITDQKLEDVKIVVFWEANTEMIDWFRFSAYQTLCWLFKNRNKVWLVRIILLFTNEYFVNNYFKISDFFFRYYFLLINPQMEDDVRGSN